MMEPRSDEARPYTRVMPKPPVVVRRPRIPRVHLAFVMLGVVILLLGSLAVFDHTAKVHQLERVRADLDAVTHDKVAAVNELNSARASVSAQQDQLQQCTYAMAGMGHIIKLEARSIQSYVHAITAGTFGSIGYIAEGNQTIQQADDELSSVKGNVVGCRAGVTGSS